MSNPIRLEFSSRPNPLDSHNGPEIDQNRPGIDRGCVVDRLGAWDSKNALKAALIGFFGLAGEGV